MTNRLVGLPESVSVPVRAAAAVKQATPGWSVMPANVPDCVDVQAMPESWVYAALNAVASPAEIGVTASPVTELAVFVYDDPAEPALTETVELVTVRDVASAPVLIIV